MAKNTFTKQFGSTFKCETCGRGTRHTGVQSMGSTLCPQCYELAGISNAVSDGESLSDYRAVVNALLEEIRAKGGNPDASFEELL